MNTLKPLRTAVVAILATAALSAASGCGAAGQPPPAAGRLTVSATEGYVGDTFTFSVGAPRDGETYSWDLDGDGYNDVAGPTEVQHVYTKAGTYKIAADVATFAVMGHGKDAWNSYYDATDFQTITVRDRPVAGGPAPNQPPTASFTTDATPGYAERPVSFDATASSDPDGQIVSYEWDFGDGSPTKTTTTPTVSHTYVPDPPQDTVYSATLRVTDDKGGTGDTKRSVPVNEFLPPDSGLAGIAAARRGTPFQATAGGQVLNAGTTIYSGGTVLHTGLYARGRMTLAKLAKPLDHKRTARWAARFTQKQHGNEDAAKFAGEGFMLLDLGHHDRLCLSGRVSGSIDAQTTGALSVAGGSGIAGHLRGSATFAIPPGSGTARGLLTLARTRKARKLPPACVSLVRKLR